MSGYIAAHRSRPGGAGEPAEEPHLPESDANPDAPAAAAVKDPAAAPGKPSATVPPGKIESLSGSRVESLSGSHVPEPDDSKVPQKHAGGLGPGVDSEVGKAVTDAGLATSEEVEYCREQQKNSSDPINRSLADLLVENSFITTNQAKRVRRLIDRKRGNRIPGYDILAEAGRGAMAKVYRAKQVSLDRMVAIKVLPKKVSGNREFVERFYKEGRAAAKLAHNNIVQAYDVNSTPDGYHYFVMEFVEGHTLYDVMQPPPAGLGRNFSEAEVLRIGIQMADALAHAHRRGLIHRDVKPKNIILTEGGVAKLTDLGLARETDDIKAAESEAGKAYGTPYYIAPEQIRGEVDIDHRADIYSLGATLYHIAVGRPPFTGDSPSAVMHMHLKDDLVPPDHLNPALGSGLSEIIEVCMKKNRDQRYQQTADLLEDLKAVEAGDAPIHARQGPDLAALAELERSPQHTVDIEPGYRLNVWQDPRVIVLLAVAAASLIGNLLLGLFSID